MIDFHTDNPITGTSESPDLLGRERFAELIGRSLLVKPGSPGVVVSIEGEWGYGKTSFLNLVNRSFDNLQPDRKPIVINFCPWLISGVENLVQEFLIQLASTIGMSDHAVDAQNAATQLLSYSKVFTAVKFIPGAEPWASLVQGVFEAVGDASKTVGNFKNLNVEERRSKVVESIKKLDRSIVVFIDDIDRIPPDEVYDLFRLVKAVADFPGVAFVLALDSDYIVNALDKFGIKHGEQYLDKIIQARVSLPHVNKKDIEHLVNRELEKDGFNECVEVFPANKGRLADLYQGSIKFILTSPRDVKKVFNRLKVVEPLTRGEVEFADLFAMEVISVKAPQLYDHIKQNPAAYTGIQPNAILNMEEPGKVVNSYSAERDSVLVKLPSHLRRPIVDLLGDLFPLLSVMRSHHKQEYFQKRGLVAANDRLLSIFSYGLPKGEVSLSVAKEFIVSPDRRDEILSTVQTMENFESFVDGLRLLSGEMQAENQEHFLRTLSTASEGSLVAEIDFNASQGFLSSGVIRKIWWVIEDLLEKTEHQARFAMLTDFISDPNRLTIGTYALRFCLNQAGFFGGEENLPEGNRWLTAAQLNEFRNIWLDSIRQSFEGEFFYDFSDKTTITYMLLRLDAELARRMFAPLTQSEKGIDCIAESFGLIGTDSTRGTFVRVEDKYLSQVFDLEDIRRVASQRIGGEGGSQRIKATHKAISTGKEVYLADLSFKKE